MPSNHDTWHWQTGKAWYGVGIYHVTLTIPTREPLLGELVIPENDPAKAWIQRTKLGDEVAEEAGGQHAGHEPQHVQAHGRPAADMLHHPPPHGP